MDFHYSSCWCRVDFHNGHFQNPRIRKSSFSVLLPQFMLLRAFIFTQMAKSAKRSIQYKNTRWPVSRKFRKHFGPEKPFVKLRTANSAGLVFSCVVNGNTTEKHCKVLCLETPSFRRYKENYVTRNAPESFGTFEKGVHGLALASTIGTSKNFSKRI